VRTDTTPAVRPNVQRTFAPPILVDSGFQATAILVEESHITMAQLEELPALCAVMEETPQPRDETVLGHQHGHDTLPISHYDSPSLRV
jgi:hypothetical protein